MLKRLRLRQTNNECTHGWDPSEFPADHDCHKFIETALEAFRCSGHAVEAVAAAVGATAEKFPDVWGDSASMEWIAAAFISIGTEAAIISS